LAQRPRAGSTSVSLDSLKEQSQSRLSRQNYREYPYHHTGEAFLATSQTINGDCRLGSRRLAFQPWLL
jgi:hypothetical protein